MAAMLTPGMYGPMVLRANARYRTSSVITAEQCIPASCQVLSAEESRMLAAVAEGFVPPNMDPQAGIQTIVEHLDRQLACCLKRMVPAYRAGLEAINRESLATTGKSLLNLSFEARLSFLASLQTGHKLTAFFSMVADESCKALGKCESPA